MIPPCFVYFYNFTPEHFFAQIYRKFHSLTINAKSALISRELGTEEKHKGYYLPSFHQLYNFSSLYFIRISKDKTILAHEPKWFFGLRT